MKIKRSLTDLKKGIRTKASDLLDIYDNLSGRVSPLKTDEDNSFAETNNQGYDKAGFRKVILTPNKPLPKILSGDLLCIPFGVRPNLWVPPGVPDGFSKYIFIDTPSGQEMLVWDGTEFVGDTVTISLVGDTWCMSGAVDYCFPVEGSSFVCQKFPEGYSFLRLSGPTFYFEILRVDVHQDDKGRIAFYTLQVDSLKQKGYYIQE